MVKATAIEVGGGQCCVSSLGIQNLSQWQCGPIKAERKQPDLYLRLMFLATVQRIPWNGAGLRSEETRCEHVIWEVSRRPGPGLGWWWTAQDRDRRMNGAFWLLRLALSGETLGGHSSLSRHSCPAGTWHSDALDAFWSVSKCNASNHLWSLLQAFFICDSGFDF